MGKFSLGIPALFLLANIEREVTAGNIFSRSGRDPPPSYSSLSLASQTLLAESPTTAAQPKPKTWKKTKSWIKAIVELFLVFLAIFTLLKLQDLKIPVATKSTSPAPVSPPTSPLVSPPTLSPTLKVTVSPHSVAVSRRVPVAPVTTASPPCFEPNLAPYAGPAEGQTVGQWLQSIVEGGVPKLEKVLFNFLQASTEAFPQWFEDALAQKKRKSERRHWLIGILARNEWELGRWVPWTRVFTKGTKYWNEAYERVMKIMSELPKERQHYGVGSWRLVRELKKIICENLRSVTRAEADRLKSLSEEQLLAMVTGQFSDPQEFTRALGSLKEKTNTRLQKKKWLVDLMSLPEKTQEAISKLATTDAVDAVEANYDLAQQELKRLDDDTKVLEKLMTIADEVANGKKIQPASVPAANEAVSLAEGQTVEQYIYSILEGQTAEQYIYSILEVKPAEQWLQSILEGGVPKLEKVLIKFLQASAEPFPQWFKGALSEVKERLESEHAWLEQAERESDLALRALNFVAVGQLKKVIQDNLNSLSEEQADRFQAFSNDRLLEMLSKGKDFFCWKEFTSELETLKEKTRALWTKKGRLVENLGKLKEQIATPEVWDTETQTWVSRWLDFSLDDVQLAKQELQQAKDEKKGLKNLMRKISPETPPTTAATSVGSNSLAGIADSDRALAKKEMSKKVRGLKRLFNVADQLEKLKRNKKKNSEQITNLEEVLLEMEKKWKITNRERARQELQELEVTLKGLRKKNYCQETGISNVFLGR